MYCVQKLYTSKLVEWVLWVCVSIYALYGQWETSYGELSIKLGVVLPLPKWCVQAVNNFYGYAPSFEEQYRQPSTTHEDPEGSDVFNSWLSGGACEEKKEVSIFL